MEGACLYLTGSVGKYLRQLGAPLPSMLEVANDFRRLGVRLVDHPMASGYR
jgi:hypothetical protein